MSDQGTVRVAGLPRGLKLGLWLAVAGIVEAALYASYLDEDGQYHWFTHFFVGASVALLVMTIVATATRRPVPLPFVWILLGHLIAMAPDLAFLEGVAHGRWMDVFLGHVSSHYIPGRNWTWYAISLAALSAYLIVIDSLRPPPAEATEQGMSKTPT